MFIRKKTAFYLFVIIAVTYLSICCVFSVILTNSNNVEIKYENYFPNEMVQDWNLMTRDSQEISAWFIKKDTAKVVILLAGKGGNRLSMLNRANYYLSNNYSVVLPDLRGTGNSKADYISLVYKDRYDVLACIDTLEQLKFTKIAAHGHSLGAAAVAFSFKDFSNYDFIVLESCYDNIDNAFAHRMQRIGLPLCLAFPIKKITEIRLGITSQELKPEKYMSRIQCPALILCGDNEWQLPVAESKKLFENCGASQKYFHVFKGAQHQDFLSYKESEYVAALEKIVP